ncbi:MAG TPA: hypothetical protein VH370_21155 [Humisphaera sp.]|jgi:hypothetical protein|nr:hypothetical protein [Humisphaera sp.]
MRFATIAVTIFVCSAHVFAQATRPTTRATTRPSASGTSPDAVMEQLLQPTTTQPKPLADPPSGIAIDKTSGPGAVAPRAPAVAVRREGTYIIDRLGRLGRTPDGSQAQFIFDADGKTLQDPPMILLPNLKLMVMEDAVKSTNADTRFRITGIVTEYRGRNYLLVDHVTVANDQQRL